ncbi:tetratricopeptide repeat protein, partial [Haemophilus influenzae]
MRFTKTLFTTALLGASIFSFQSTAWADTLEQQFQQGSEATTRGDYQTTFKFLLPLAEQGNAEAQLMLGVMYARGIGVKQDDFEAVKWYRQAAEQGYANAQA